MSGVPREHLETILRERLAPVEHISVGDTSDGCGQSFDVVVVSSRFDGMSLLQRHRLVNDVAKDEIAQIHAFSQKTYTPAQWAEQQAKQA